MDWFEQLLSSLLNENKPIESPSKSKDIDEFTDSTRTSASDVEAACQQIVDYLVQNILGMPLHHEVFIYDYYL